MCRYSPFYVCSFGAVQCCGIFSLQFDGCFPKPQPKLAESRKKQICIALFYVATWAVCCPVAVQLEETQTFFKTNLLIFLYETIN